MAKTFNTFLFGDYRIATATSGRSTYKHTFGGPHDRKGTSRIWRLLTPVSHRRVCDIYRLA